MATTYKTKVVVEQQEAEANTKAAATKAIADDAQRDLDEALPALIAEIEAALEDNDNTRAAGRGEKLNKLLDA